MRGFDATNPFHLPLPRAVGDYQIIRTTQVVDFGQIASDTASPIPQLAFFSPIAYNRSISDVRWASACGIASLGTNVNGANSSYMIPMSGLVSLELAAIANPAAITIQVMNPGALQTEAGIVYIGRSHAQYDLAGSSRTWTSLGNEFVQFMSPRLCSAGKLVLRGVKASAYPLDMSEASSFRGLEFPGAGTAAGKFTWDSRDSSPFRPEAFTPLVIYNPNSVALQVLVTMEWRVRFDPGNPAASSHAFRGVTSDATWGRLISTMSNMGHGVMDITEDALEVAGVAAGVAAML